MATAKTQYRLTKLGKELEKGKAFIDGIMREPLNNEMAFKVMAYDGVWFVPIWKRPSFIVFYNRDNNTNIKVEVVK